MKKWKWRANGNVGVRCDVLHILISYIQIWISISVLIHAQSTLCQCIWITALSTSHQQANNQLISSTSDLLLHLLTSWSPIVSFSVELQMKCFVQHLKKKCSVSLSQSWRPIVANWLCQASDCEDWPVDKRVSSWRTLTLIVMPTNSIFRTRTGKMEVRVNLMAPRIKHWSTNERPVTCAAAYISDIKHLFRMDESG